MLKLGDRIVSSKIKPLVPGYVIGITHPAILGIAVNKGDTRAYSELYDDWVEKPLIFVKFDEPQFVMNFNDYKEELTKTIEKYAENDVFFKAVLDSDELLNKYIKSRYQSTDKTSFIILPYDDCSLIYEQEEEYTLV